MIIIEQPSAATVCITQPVLYTFSQTVTGSNAVPCAVECIFELNGVELDAIYLEAFSVSSATNTECTFRINVAELLIKHSNNLANVLVNWFYNGNTTGYIIQSPQVFRLKLTAYMPNTEGVLVKDNATETYTAAKYFINAYLKEHETISALDTFIVQTSNRRFLSTPSKFTLSRTDFQLITYLKPANLSLPTLTVQFYQVSNLVGTGIVSLPDLELNDAAQNFILGIHPANIALLQFDTFSGNTNVNDATHYTLTLTGSATITVYIVESCRGYRLHFLNRFGFFDSIMLKTDINNSIKPKSETFERAFSTLSKHTETHLYRRAETQCEGYAQNLSPSEAVWLEELLMSPLAFWEKEEVLLPVIIEDEQNDLKVTGEMTTYKIKFRVSNKRVSQRN